jgi:hypothetical protein
MIFKKHIMSIVKKLPIDVKIKVLMMLSKMDIVAFQTVIKNCSGRLLNKIPVPNRKIVCVLRRCGLVCDAESFWNAVDDGATINSPHTIHVLVKYHCQYPIAGHINKVMVSIIDMKCPITFKLVVELINNEIKSRKDRTNQLYKNNIIYLIQHCILTENRIIGQMILKKNKRIIPSHVKYALINGKFGMAYWLCNSVDHALFAKQACIHGRVDILENHIKYITPTQQRTLFTLYIVNGTLDILKLLYSRGNITKELIDSFITLKMGSEEVKLWLRTL